MIARADFVATVRSFEGTPFHHQGRTPGVGMDCPGPIIVACWMLGLKPRSFDVRGYESEPDGHTLKALCDEHMEPVSLEQAREGDVILAAFDKDAMRPRHLGVLIDPTPSRRYWVQAEGRAHKKVMKSRLVFGDGYMRLVQAYRIPGID